MACQILKLLGEPDEASCGVWGQQGGWDPGAPALWGSQLWQMESVSGSLCEPPGPLQQDTPRLSSRVLLPLASLLELAQTGWSQPKSVLGLQPGNSLSW